MSKPFRPLTRRDFVRGTVGTALAGSVVGVPGILRAGEAVSEGAAGLSRSAVTVVRDAAALDDRHKVDTAVLEEMLSATICGVTGLATAREAWQSLFKPQDVVGLVPTPHLNPTHDEVIDAVTAALVDAGVPAGNVRKATRGPDTAEPCTALIALPGLKAHWLTGIGTVIKNYIMFSGKPAKYHGEDSAKLGEIWLLPEVKDKTRLVLVDALRPLCSKGPQPDPRYMWHYNGLIAGADPVAVETVCLRIIQHKRNALRGGSWPLSPPPICVEAADTTYGLGNSDYARIDVHTSGWDEELLIEG